MNYYFYWKNYIMEEKKVKELSVPQQNKIAAESASRRLAFVALLGALRELSLAWMSEVVFGDKYIIKQAMESITRMFRHFDKEGLTDNQIYDDMVSHFIDSAEDMRKQTEEIMLSSVDHGEVSEVQEADESK